MLLTIDPGNDTGWALWFQDSDLWSLNACGHADHWMGFRPNRALIESPVIYPRSPVPPNDIVKLARLAGECGGRLKDRGVRVQYVEPATWKGQVKKPIHTARTRAKIKAKLSQEEQDLVRAACSAVAPSAQHNIIDAVGLGLWALKI